MLRFIPLPPRVRLRRTYTRPAARVAARLSRPPADRPCQGPRPRADTNAVPTHRDLPDDWPELARRRSQEVDAADGRARDGRRRSAEAEHRAQGELDKAADAARARTSSPPPKRA
jgi:hypothetical protein